MQALLVIDAQNEFSEHGQRAVSNHKAALRQIQFRVQQARGANLPIAWIRHYNKPDESPAFVPGTWGSELSPGLKPDAQKPGESLFEKNVFGAFTGTGLESWLRTAGVDTVLLVGFYTHMCLSTTAREALVRGFHVFIDPYATGATDLNDSRLGTQPAAEVQRTALLQLRHMGVQLTD